MLDNVGECLFASFTKPIINVFCASFKCVRDKGPWMSGSRLRAGPALGPIQRSIMPRLWALRWRVPGVIPPMLKPQSVLRKLERGNPHCWLKFSEWNEFKTENNDLNPRGPIRYFSL